MIELNTCNNLGRSFEVNKRDVAFRLAVSVISHPIDLLAETAGKVG